MYMLQIEHPVIDFHKWKHTFDSDPVNREKMGVLRYRISSPITDDKFVIIELEFNTLQEAQALLEELRIQWKKVTGEIVMNPQVQILEIIETRELKMAMH